MTGSGPDSTDTVRYEQVEYIARIMLDRPAKMNALDESAWKDLTRTLRRASEDDEVRVTMLTGHGEGFCTGDDIGEMREWETTEEAVHSFREIVQPAFEELRCHPKPVIAVVDGPAYGGGCELVMLSDIAVSSSRSEYALPEARIGAFPPIALTYGRDAIAEKHLMELVLTGKSIPAEKAKDIGLVNHVMDHSDIDEYARQIARATTSSAPASVRAIKETRNGVEGELRPALDEAMKRVGELLSSDIGNMGIDAFIEDQSPPWRK